ncbi:MAG: hypothetical protein HYY93_01620 [Planctomycetes bacterium]|nr:hypothetical protein [Planctomycetota bacterium]
MSLKAFHIFFILVSTAFALGFGGWALREYARDGGLGMLATGAGSCLSSVALAVYGVWFLRKLKHVSYL